MIYIVMSELIYITTSLLSLQLQALIALEYKKIQIIRIKSGQYMVDAIII